MRIFIIQIAVVFVLMSIPTMALSQQRYIRGRNCDSLSTAPMPGVVVELNDDDGNTIKYTTTGEDAVACNPMEKNLKFIQTTKNFAK
ncbi:MAG: hypothetical protein ACI3Z0_06530 [Candidatus Cryptobacteroides sp.]